MQTGAREAALETLMRCRRDGAWSGASIDAGIKKYELSRRDAALASRLCLGVIQNSSLCDYYIGCCCGAKLEPKVRDILRMGCISAAVSGIGIPGQSAGQRGGRPVQKSGLRESGRTR